MLGKTMAFRQKIIDPCWALKCSSLENPQVRQNIVWIWQIRGSLGRCRHRHEEQEWIGMEVGKTRMEKLAQVVFSG